MTLQTNDNQITRPYVADRKATKRHRGLLVRYQAIKGSLGKDFSIRVVVVFCFFWFDLGRCSAAPSRGTRRAGVGQCERREDQGGRGEAGGAELIDDDDCIGLAGRVERVHRDVIVPRVVLPRK